MNSKKTLITIIIIIVIAAAGWYFWKGGFSSFGIGGTSSHPWTEGTSSQPGIGGQTGDQTTGEIGSVGKMTDDIYVDMMVKIVEIQAKKNPATYAAEVASLYKKYNITEESMAAYAKELEKDPTRAMNIAQKYSQRVAEMQSATQ